MVVNEDRGIYAIGSQSYITVIDDRISKDVLTIPSQQIGAGLDFKWPSCLLLWLKLWDEVYSCSSFLPIKMLLFHSNSYRACFVYLSMCTWNVKQLAICYWQNVLLEIWTVIYFACMSQQICTHSLSLGEKQIFGGGRGELIAGSITTFLRYCNWLVRESHFI